jgi:FixJ family two-component response regulator
MGNLKKRIIMSKQFVLCMVSDSQTREKLLTDLTTVLEKVYTAIPVNPDSQALDEYKELLEDGTEIPLVIIDCHFSKNAGREFLKKLRTFSPNSIFLLIFDHKNFNLAQDFSAHFDLCRLIKKPWQTDVLWFTIHEALKSYERELDSRKQLREMRTISEKAQQERQIIDKLSRILNEKITELVDQQQELEQISKELNVTTIEKIMIEQEAIKLSKTLSTLKNSLKNNLFIRSILHSIVNILQIQFSIDRRENKILDQLEKEIAFTLNELNDNYNKLVIKKELYDLQHLITGKLIQQRKKSELNLHKSLFGYVKAVQCTLLGETVNFTSRPCHLLGVLKKVKEKYKEILESDTLGKKIDFVIELHNPDIYLNILDFSLINIIENLLTNSIRKVLEDISKKEKWIKISSYEEIINNKEYTVLKWMDNGPGISEDRKKSIFEGDTDKQEKGDHGVGLSDIKISIEAVGGFISEVGVYKKGATFLMGLPKADKIEEINFDEDLENGIKFSFPARMLEKKLLVVTDDKMLLKDYQDFFKNCGLKEAAGAFDEKQALDLILSGQFIPDLLIIDMENDNRLQYSLPEQLKIKNHTIPTIIISANLRQKGKNNDDLLRLEKSGVRDIMEKPANLKLLFEHVTRILAEKPVSTGSQKKKRNNSQRN